MRFRRHPVANLAKSDLLAAAPLDAALIDRLKASYALVRSQETQFADVFYRKLFAAAPALRQMFKSDPATQAKKLTDALDTIVRNLESPEDNATMLAELGRRHVAYGVKPEHYDLVIDLLIESMRETLGTATSDDGLREWRTALRLISDRMIDAAAAPNDA